MEQQLHRGAPAQRTTRGARRWLACTALAVATSGLVGIPTAANAAVTPVPSVVAAPTTLISRPYGTNDGGVAELSSLGYVQEEFFFSGTAAGQPYTTRMLVRRPADPARFSGIVIAESIRSTGSRSMWGVRDYLTRSGHAYVELGSNHGTINTLVKPSNTDRYGSLVMPAIEGGLFGHVMEIMAQGGMVLKSNLANGPFTGFTVEHVVLAGCSEQGTIIRQYMRDSHALYRTADGAPIFDGYFPACVADWPEQFLLVNGQPLKNFVPGAIDVPVINFATQEEPESWPETNRVYRRPDADGPSDFYRVYEVAGMPHGVTRHLPTTRPCDGKQASRFPGHHFAASALDKLIRWVDDGTIPLRAPHLSVTAANGPLLKDVHGNALGGIRSAHLDVPVASYHTCLVSGYEVPFSPQKLAQLYGTPGTFVDRFIRRVDQLVAEGWYLAEDAQEARTEAAQTALGWIRDRSFGAGSLVDSATLPDDGGYWLVATDGGVFPVGNAQYHGSTSSLRLNQPVAAITPTASGSGYWLVARDGGVFNFGDATFHGSAGNLPLSSPIVDLQPSPSGRGYRLLAADGRSFAYGDARVL